MCHNEIDLIPPPPIRLCHILVTPSPPSLEVKWQSIFYSPPFMLCYIVLQLIPLRSPSKTIQSPLRKILQPPGHE